MINAAAVTTLSKLQKLLDELRDRCWQGLLSPRDVSRLLGSRGRVADATIRDAVQQGLLQKKSETEYKLTKIGLSKISTKATWSSTTMEKNPPGDPGSLRLSPELESDSLINARLSGCGVSKAGPQGLVKRTYYIPKGYIGERNIPKTKNVSSILDLKILNNNKTTSRARSKSDAKKSSTKRRKKREQRFLHERAKAVIADSRNSSFALRPPPLCLTFDDSVKQHKAYDMAVTYESQLGAYCNRPTLKYLNGIVRAGTRGYKLWVRASQQAEELAVTYETYCRAQFYWFDRWFNRAPKPQELSSYKSKINASDRVRLYEQEVAKGQTDSSLEILGPVRTVPKVSRAVRFGQSKRQLASLMKNYNATEEKILKAFAKGRQAFVFFDREWLQTNETYKRLKKAGEL